MKQEYEILGQHITVSTTRRDGGRTVTIDDVAYEVSSEPTGIARHNIVVNGVRHSVWIARQGNTEGDAVFIHAFGRSWRATELDPLAEIAATAGGASDNIVAPMPGTVVSVSRAVGDQVSEGDTLMVIESMKLQTTIMAPHDAIIAEIHFEQDATFEKAAVLITFAAQQE